MENLTNLSDIVLNKHGINKQLDMLIEECSEVIHSICKLKRSKHFNYDCLTSLENEMADLLNVTEQIINYFNFTKIDSIRKTKLLRAIKDAH